jgi:hypothetical protein
MVLALSQATYSDPSLQAVKTKFVHVQTKKKISNTNIKPKISKYLSKAKILKASLPILKSEELAVETKHLEKIGTSKVI